MVQQTAAPEIFVSIQGGQKERPETKPAFGQGIECILSVAVCVFEHVFSSFNLSSNMKLTTVIFAFVC
jgi:hypothetical protein